MKRNQYLPVPAKRAAMTSIALLLMTTSVQAATVEYTTTLSDQITNYTDRAVTVSQFDSSLGTLSSATVTLQGTTSGSVSYESADASATTITVSFGAELGLSTTALSDFLVVLTSSTNDFSATAFDGAVDFDGTSGATVTDLTANQSGSVQITGTDLAEFIGTGNVDLSLTGSGLSSATGSGNLATFFRTAAGGTVTVTYTYDEVTPPDADAGGDATVDAGDMVTLNGTGSSPAADDGTLTYAWSQTAGTSVMLSDVNAAQPTFTAPALAVNAPDAELTFSLVVEEGSVSSEADTVTITVVSEKDMTPPDAPTLANTSVTPNPDASVTVSGTTEPNASVTVTFPDGSNDTVMAASNGAYAASSGPDQPDGMVTVVATDAAANPSAPLMIPYTAGEVVAAAQTAITDFVQSRAAHVIGAQPDLTGFLTGNVAGAFNVDATRDNGTFDVATGGNQSVWARVQGNWSTSGETENTYLFGVVGAHYKINPDVLVGVMLQFDRMSQEATDTTAEGTGYLAGPYFVAKLPSQPLYLEGRYLVGETENSYSAGGADDQDFATERSLASVKLSGQMSYGELVLTPNLSATRFQDTQIAFTDNGGFAVPEQSIIVNDVSLGMDFAMPISVAAGDLLLTGGVSGIWSQTEGSGLSETVTSDYEGERVRVHLASRYTTDSGMVLTAGVSHDGFGVDDYESWGVNFGLEKKF